MSGDGLVGIAMNLVGCLRRGKIGERGRGNTKKGVDVAREFESR